MASCSRPDGPVPTAVVGEGLAAAATAARLAQDPRFTVTLDDPALVVAVGGAVAPEVGCLTVRLGTPDRSPGPPWVDARQRTATVLAALHTAARTGRVPEPASASRLHGALTERERAVLALVGEGLTRDELAERLGMSPNTVRTHLQNLRAKLGARSRHELVVMANGGRTTPDRLPAAPVVDAPWRPPLPELVGTGRPTVVCGGWPVRLEGLALVCEASRLHVQACAAGERAAVQAVTGHGADVVLVAGQPPDTTLGGLVAAVLGAGAATVIVLADTADDDDLVAVVEAGADGYLGPEAGPDELLAALDAAAAGEPVIPRRMLGTLLRTLVDRRRAEREALLRWAELSLREREILGLLAAGLDHQAIAEALVVSPHTARTHIQNTLRKLGVHSRAEAAALVGRYRLPAGSTGGVA